MRLPLMRRAIGTDHPIGLAGERGSTREKHSILERLAAGRADKSQEATFQERCRD